MDSHTMLIWMPGTEFLHYKPLMRKAKATVFYQSEDEDSGEFTYFAFSPDTIEPPMSGFRCAEDL